MHNHQPWRLLAGRPLHALRERLRERLMSNGFRRGREVEPSAGGHREVIRRRMISPVSVSLVAVLAIGLQSTAVAASIDPYAPELTIHGDPDGYFERSQSLPFTRGRPGSDPLHSWRDRLDLASLTALQLTSDPHTRIRGERGPVGDSVWQAISAPHLRDAPHGQGLGEGISPVPLPSALWLFASGLIGFIGLSVRRSV